MAKDTKHKKEARAMYKLTKHINSRYMSSYKAEVTCKTCHRGKEKPSSR